MVSKVDEEEFNRASAVPVADSTAKVAELQQRITASLPQFDDPVAMQKYLAAQTKAFLDARLEKEVAEFGRPSDNTRAWVKEYNMMLDSIQKNSNEGKRTADQINMSHALLAAMIRKSAKDSKEIIDATIIETKDSGTEEQKVT